MEVVRPATAVLAFWVMCAPAPAPAYSILTHEAIIDSLWNTDIVPLLRKRYPHASPQDLQEAQAYAYGGCIIQDLGYYPFGSRFFSDLVHYVRTGDFVRELLKDAADLNELAFAVGALAHYAADTIGHPGATNKAVALEYPKLRRKYGDSVTFGEKPDAHIKVEFGFDVIEVAKGRYAPKSYHDFVGFKVSKELLDRAFPQVYGIELKDALPLGDLAIGSYRFAIGRTIPFATKVAWQEKRDEIVRSQPGMTQEKFVYNLSRANYNQEWGREYKQPGVFAKILAFFVRIIPKVGPFRPLALKMPSQETERLFMASFNGTLERARGMISALRADDASFHNRDFDTGRATSPGEYALADKTHAELLRKLTDSKLDRVTPALRKYMLAFFRGSDLPGGVKPDKRSKTRQALEILAASAGDVAVGP